MNPYLRKAAGILFPGTCISCGTLVDPTEFICAECRERIRHILPPFCPYCGTSQVDCRCRKSPHAYEANVAPFYYEDAIRDAILGFKFGAKEETAVYLGKAMSQTIAARYYGIPFTLVTCVPSTSHSLGERGYNQAQSLVEQLDFSQFTWLSKKPTVDCHLLKKNETGEMQHFLGAEARRENIRNAYALKKNRRVDGETILLIDDIVTTGATANEISVILKLMGAREVYIASAAITRNTGAQGAKNKGDSGA